jgi:hypothetical protein
MATMDTLMEGLKELVLRITGQETQMTAMNQNINAVSQRLDQANTTAGQANTASQQAIEEITRKLLKAEQAAVAANDDLKTRIGLDKSETGGGFHDPEEEEAPPKGKGKGPDGLYDIDLAGVGGWNGPTGSSQGKGRGDSENPHPYPHTNTENKERLRNLEEKSYRRIEKFLTGEPEWQEFTFDMLVTTRALNPEIAYHMETMMKMKEVSPDHLDNLYRTDRDISKASKELYEVLCQLTGGQAKSLMRGIDGSDGLRAWRVLHTTYARDTLARTLRLYREVINPTQCTNAEQIITVIGKWETKLKELERHTGDPNARLPEMVKLAALTEICTNDVRDLVYQNADTGCTYAQIREKIIGWTSNRIAASAANMDIGMVDQTQCYACEPCGQDFTGEFTEINMAGKCFNCGTVGHPARLCPNKGKGKGGYQGKGGAKGGGKSTWTPMNQGNPGYNPKGGGKGFGGKGYQGNCFTCGQKGHKAAECQARRTNSVETAEEEETITREVGGVWLMGHVSKVVETHNRFQGLTRKEEEQDDDWQPVTSTRKAKVFPSKARVNLTTRNICDRHNQPTSKKKVVSLPGAHPREHVVKKTLPVEKVIASVERAESTEEMVEKLVASTDRTSAVCQMTFHVTDANKVLASVTKMTEAGNRVDFNKRRSFIESPDGKKAHLRKRGGVYVLDVIFFDGDKAVKGEVIVDSGAADNVMPRGMLTGIDLREKEKGTRFVAADGGELGNYGRKDVQFCPVEFWEAEFGTPFQGQTH